MILYEGRNDRGLSQEPANRLGYNTSNRLPAAPGKATGDNVGGQVVGINRDIQACPFPAGP